MRSGLLIGEVVAAAQARVCGSTRLGLRGAGGTAGRSVEPLADLVDRPGRGPDRLCLPRRPPERRHHFGGPPAPLQRRVLCGHLRGVQGAGLRGHPARKLHPPRSVDPLAPGRARAAPTRGDPRVLSHPDGCCSFSWRSPSPSSSSRCSSGRAWPGERRPSPPWSAPWPASGPPSSSPTTCSGRPDAGSSPFSASGWCASSS